MKIYNKNSFNSNCFPNQANSKRFLICTNKTIESIIFFIKIYINILFSKLQKSFNNSSVIFCLFEAISFSNTMGLKILSLKYYYFLLLGIFQVGIKVIMHLNQNFFSQNNFSNIKNFFKK